MNNIKQIGIAGCGMVGGNLRNWMERNLNVPIVSFDPPKGKNDIELLNKSDIIFVCVPTPYLEDKGFDLLYVEDIMKKLTGHKIIILKSTILPGTTDKLQEKYPEHRLYFNPEFLTENQAGYDLAHPKRQILGMSKKVEEEYNLNEETRLITETILKMLPKAPFSVYVPAKVAEMVKLAGNTWFSTKVIFGNQLYDLCEKLNINYKSVKTCMAAEPMIGNDHLDIFHNGFRGFGNFKTSKCLPKDTLALISFGDNAGVEMKLLKKVVEINNELDAKN